MSALELDRQTDPDTGDQADQIAALRREVADLQNALEAHGDTLRDVLDHARAASQIAQAIGPALANLEQSPIGRMLGGMMGGSPPQTGA